MTDDVFITLPLGEREEVDIRVSEIAAMRSHVVTSYSYVDYTEVTLRNSGVKYDCRINKRDLLERISRAVGVS